MRILKFSRNVGGFAGSAEIQLTEMEVRAISNLLYKQDKPNDIVSGLNKDFFVLRELLHHGGGLTDLQSKFSAEQLKSN